MKASDSDTLATLLGRLENLFEPENLTDRGYAAQWQYRQMYLREGVLPWRNTGNDMAGKKALARTMETLAGRGLVKFGGRVAGLTVAGLDKARRIVGHISVKDAMPGLDFMLAKMDTPAAWNDGQSLTGWICESTLAGFPAMPPGVPGKTRLPSGAADWTIAAMMPLAIAGLVKHGFKPWFELPLYHLTETGMELAERRSTQHQARPGDWPKLKKRVLKHREPESYFTAWRAEQEEMPNRKPIWPNRIAHGLNGFLWPQEVTDIPEDERDRMYAAEMGTE